MLSVFFSISLDMLELFFENSARSGGGKILNHHMNDEQDVLIITFEEADSEYIVIVKIKVVLIISSGSFYPSLFLTLFHKYLHHLDHIIMVNKGN